MHQLLLTALIALIATTAFGQNSAGSSQQSSAMNAAFVTESGEGSSQTDIETTDGSKPGNRVSVRIPRGTKTTIGQHNRGDGPFGPNSIEIAQSVKATAAITPLVETGHNRIRPLPTTPDSHSKDHPAKRRNWR